LLIQCHFIISELIAVKFYYMLVDYFWYFHYFAIEVLSRPTG